MATMVLKHVSVLSAAAWLTAAFFVLGIFAGMIYTASFSYSGQISGMVVIWYLLLTPVLYACVGLFAALIICVLYNNLNGVFGGIALELADPNGSFESPPLPPSQWPPSSLVE